MLVPYMGRVRTPTGRPSRKASQVCTMSSCAASGRFGDPLPGRLSTEQSGLRSSAVRADTDVAVEQCCE